MAKDLHESRLATTDESGHRVFLHPEDVKGKWKDRRMAVYWSLILVYLVAPWIYIEGKQLFLLDIVKREFTLFGYTFFSHDTPLLLFVLLAWVFAFAFLTSVWGRVWCGWGCPQTVFIDAIFRKIEIFTEGKARARKKLDAEPWNSKKIIKKSIKWTLYLAVSLHIVHSFLGYFVGTRKLFQISLSPPWENPVLFGIMLFCTTIILFDFGWFREQFCVIMCPYGRLQSILMDQSSKVILYDRKRGEPRRGTIERENEGDCIDCHHCVTACPTGIDIRRGTQLECIACTACIDACDDIMRKIDKPEGLIRYDSEESLDGKETKFFKPRTIMYFLIFMAIGGAFTGTLINRSGVTFVYTHGVGKPFKVKETPTGKEVTNYFHVHYTSKMDEVKMKVSILPIKDSDKIRLTMPRNPFVAKKGKNKLNMFFRFPMEILSKGGKKIQLQVTTEDGTIVDTQEIKIVGPYSTSP